MNNMVNTSTNEIEKTLKKFPQGQTITDLVNNTKLSRGQIRTTLSFMLGAERIIERKTGMAKLYFLKK
jgi:hypothetical protein